MARETLALYQRHPWLLQVNQARPVIGPGALTSMEKMMALIKPMGLSDVSGVARTRVYEEEAETTSGMTDAAFWEAQRPALEAAMASGAYPVMASLSEDTFASGFDHFEFGLRRILDGLDVLVAARGGDGGDGRGGEKR